MPPHGKMVIKPGAHYQKQPNYGNSPKKSLGYVKPPAKPPIHDKPYGKPTTHDHKPSVHGKPHDKSPPKLGGGGYGQPPPKPPGYGKPPHKPEVEPTSKPMLSKHPNPYGESDTPKDGNPPPKALKKRTLTKVPKGKEGSISHHRDLILTNIYLFQPTRKLCLLRYHPQPEMIQNLAWLQSTSWSKR